jgi:hypothetical protein
MKVVGRRNVQSKNVWESVGQLTKTAERLRGSRALVPRGVHRFETFEEANEWMIRTIASTHVRLRRKTSSGSVRR